MSNALALDDRNYPSAPQQPWSSTIEAIAADGTVRVRIPDGRATAFDFAVNRKKRKRDDDEAENKLHQPPKVQPKKAKK